MVTLFEKQEYVDVISILDNLYTWVACNMGITSNPRTFIHFSLEAMKRLEDTGKPNLVFKFCQGLAVDRPNNAGPLIPIDRMPFGLMQYSIEFFTCTNVMQVCVTVRLSSLSKEIVSWGSRAVNHLSMNLIEEEEEAKS